VTHSKLNTEALASSRKEGGHDWSVVIRKAFFSGNALLESHTEIGGHGALLKQDADSKRPRKNVSEVDSDG
jgi:hypothetical protein